VCSTQNVDLFKSEINHVKSCANNNVRSAVFNVFVLDAAIAEDTVKLLISTRTLRLNSSSLSPPSCVRPCLDRYVQSTQPF